MRRLLLLSLLLASQSGHAAPTFQLEANGEFYPSAQAACEAAIPIVQQMRTNGTVTGAKAQYGGSPARDACLFDFLRNDGQQFSGQGFSCPSGTPCFIYRTSCDAGTTDTLTWPLGREEVAVGDPSFVAFGFPLPQTYCFSGCNGTVNPGGTGQDLFGQPDTDPKYEVIFANVTYDLDGTACTTVGREPIPDVPPPPEPDPCDTNPQGEGCSTDPGDGGGDPGDGGDTGGGDPGDGGDTGGGDTGGGDTGGGDTGGGDTGGGDTGGGDTGGTGVSGIDCDKPLSCSGDAVACAQLQLQKNTHCANVAANDFPGQTDEIADFLDQPAFASEDDEEINLAGMFSEGTRFLPSSCPPDESFSLTTNGGRTFSFSYQPLCQFASDLSYLIVAAAAVFFAVYVGRATGGE